MRHRHREKTATERELADSAAARSGDYRLGYVALAVEAPPGYLLHPTDRTAENVSRNRTEEIFELVRRSLFPDRPSRYTWALHFYFVAGAVRADSCFADRRRTFTSVAAPCGLWPNLLMFKAAFTSRSIARPQAEQ